MSNALRIYNSPSAASDLVDVPDLIEIEIGVDVIARIVAAQEVLNDLDTGVELTLYEQGITSRFGRSRETASVDWIEYDGGFYEPWNDELFGSSRSGAYVHIEGAGMVTIEYRDVDATPLFYAYIGPAARLQQDIVQAESEPVKPKMGM